MYLGIDLGTSGVKALLIDEGQSVVDEAHAPLTVQRPHPGWSEQRPADWLTATSAVLDQLAARNDLGGVRGIGLSGQMHGATLLDAADNVLRDCILWNDTRSAGQAARLDDDPRFREISGNIVFPGFTAPKLVWVSENEPEIFKRVARVLLPKDYLRLWLTGEAVSEMSDAAGTSWFATGARDWSDTLLAASGMTREQMPRLVEGSASSGGLRREIASRWGMKPDTVVAGGGGDNAASGIGMGVVRAGQAFVSLGTSGVLFAACDSYRPDANSSVHTFCHAIPETWHQMGVILSATDSLNWYAGVTGRKAGDLTADLDVLQQPGRAMFLPYLGGERTPHNDAKMRGALIGISHQTDVAAGTRAVIEGVTFAVRDCFDALSATGTRFDSLIAVGGGSRSDYWLSAIATALNIPIQIPEAGDFGGAFGAARLAMMSVTDGGLALATPPAIAREVNPVADLIEPFSVAHERYKRSYEALKELS